MTSLTEGTNNPLQRVSTNDQLAAIVNFLDELEIKTPIKHFQRETEGNKALLDTINSLISVGAFIAGVQASMISITSNSNKTAIGRATNWFAFVGLTLDLIGTGAGIARALLLQATIRRTNRLAVRITGQIDGARHRVRELRQRGADLSTDKRAHTFLTHTVRGISRVVALLAEDGRFGLQAAESITQIEAAGEAALDALGARRRAGWIKSPWVTRALLFWGVRLGTHVEGLGHIPVASLVGGTLCLLASVILFAGASQRQSVWISCTAIAVTMVAFSIFPITSNRGRRHAALYDRADDMLQDCPPVEPPVYRAPQEDPGM